MKRPSSFGKRSHTGRSIHLSYALPEHTSSTQVSFTHLNITLGHKQAFHHQGNKEEEPESPAKRDEKQESTEGGAPVEAAFGYYLYYLIGFRSKVSAKITDYLRLFKK
jgi:hypothetical protein